MTTTIAKFSVQLPPRHELGGVMRVVKRVEIVEQGGLRYLRVNDGPLSPDMRAEDVTISIEEK